MKACQILCKNKQDVKGELPKSLCCWCKIKVEWMLQKLMICMSHRTSPCDFSIHSDNSKYWESPLCPLFTPFLSRSHSSTLKTRVEMEVGVSYCQPRVQLITQIVGPAQPSPHQCMSFVDIFFAQFHFGLCMIDMLPLFHQREKKS